MTQKEINEGNLVICKFIDNPVVFNDILDTTLLNIKEHGAVLYSIDELKYHTSWDWLMKVIEKCREKDPPMRIYEYNQYIMQSFNYLDIEETWKAVIKFIKWYNEKENNKSKN